MHNGHFRHSKLEKGQSIYIRDPRIRFAIKVLESGNSVTLTAVANELNLSASRFRHLFKNEVSISPACYLKRARLAQAKILVERSYLRIKEVAASVGLNDVSHFVRDYKALYGQTPSQTRRFVNSRQSTPL